MNYDNLSTEEILEGVEFKPHDLENVGNIDGMTIYSSSYVKEQFKKVYQSNKFNMDLYPEIVSLVDRNILIPTYTTNSLIMHFLKKVVGSREDYAGVYIHEQHRMFVLINDSIGWSELEDEKDIIQTTIHEIQHYSAAVLKKSYFSFNKSTFAKFYATFIGEFIDAKVSPADALTFANFIYEKFEMNWQLNDFDKDYIIPVRKMFEKYGKTESQKILIYNFPVINIIRMWDPDSFIDGIYGGNPSIVKWWKAIIYTYKQSGLKNWNSFFGQEVIFPSEVTAMLCMGGEAKYNKPAKAAVKRDKRTLPDRLKIKGLIRV